MFEFATAGRIIFGRGTLKEAAPATAAFGKRAFIVTGKDPARAQPLLDALKTSGVAPHLFSVPGEPTTDIIIDAVKLARESRVDLVIGFGGGSAIDTAKAVAALLTNPGDLLDYLEVIGKAQPLRQAPVPCIAIPTTAGTGAEVTRNAVLQSPAHSVKVSLRSLLMLPRLAIVDPELTYSLPPDVTAATGLDALTQLIEPYVSNRANPLTDALCVEGITRAARSLLRACASANDPAARQDMAVASLFGGLALANAGLGAVHGFAAPIGGMFDAPHGAVCAALLPHVVRVNLQAVRERGKNPETLNRFEHLARIVTGSPTANADDLSPRLLQLVTDCKIPNLRHYGIRESHIPPLCEKAAAASSMKANSIALTDLELRDILRSAI